MSGYSATQWLRLRPLIVLAALLWLAPTVAWAHMLPKQNATIKITGTSAFCVVSVPVSALSGVDDNGDGLLSAAEIRKHAPEIQRQFEAGFQLSNGGARGVSMFSWVAPPQGDDPLHNDYVVVLHRSDFTEVPRSIRLATTLFGAATGEGQLTVKATLGEVSEVAMVSPDGPEYQFFRGKLALFTDSVRVGVNHILTGADHLLFLLTILAAAAGWRYWLGVVTSFTVAHTITLSLSAFDLVQVSSPIVEPGIAASIVLMAVLNLKRATPGDARAAIARVALVFACGLLHGLGFASAIAEMLTGSSNRFITLAGFNLGIEIGQFLFLAGVMMLTFVAGKLARAQLVARIPQVASVVAALLGTLLLARQASLL